jgi:quercetin dioxygenase-like cupin family protein
MAHAGQVLISRSGQRIVFRRTSGNTSGMLLELDFFLPPGGSVLGEHVHPLQEERFEVCAGSFRLRRKAAEISLSVGDSAIVPRGAPHYLQADGDREAWAVVQFRPALETERLFELLFELANEREASRKIRKLSTLLGWLSAHPGQIYLSRLPVVLQQILLRPFEWRS